MLKIGITGGIGSGKSTVCRIFESLGVSVYYADDRARKLIEEHPLIIEGYKRLFGDEVYLNGQLNRKLVGQQIFSDKSLLNKVNELVHPVVRDDFLQWVKIQDSPYVLEEAAVLLESGGHKHLDKVVLVRAPEILRINRVMMRDGIEPDMVKQRMNNQWTDEQRRPFCDYVIFADDVHLVTPQVLEIHHKLLKSSALQKA